MLPDCLEEKIIYCLTNGLVTAKEYQEVQSSSGTVRFPVVHHVPFSLRPYSIPREAFDTGVNLAKYFNILVHRVSMDSLWLAETLKYTIQNDSFTQKLYNLHKHALELGIAQKWSLGIHRSDYMIHERENDPRKLLQVEINTISSSLGSLATKMTGMCQTFLKGSNVSCEIPPNHVLDNICLGIATAYNIFCEEHKGSLFRKPVVLFVVQPNEWNISDQKLIQYGLMAHGIECVRYSLQDIHLLGVIDSNTRMLSIHGQTVAVAYFRAGYSPNDYNNDGDWNGRTLIENSKAIKCPTIAYHLAGTKKVQQALAAPGALERFLNPEIPEEKNAIDLIRSVFAGLYSLDYKEGGWDHDQLALFEKVRSHPEHFVMKPQREGGGNNIYGVDIVTALNSMTPEELSAYILMERINTPSQLAILVRNSMWIETKCVCELGIFGVFLGNGRDTVSLNAYGGYTLRVKPATSNEGGVAAGYAVLGCPCFATK